MTSFDYLHDAVPPLVARLTRVRVPRPYVPVSVALLCVVCVMCGATALERLRIAQATTVQTEQRARLFSAQRALAQAKLDVRDVNSLVALDATIADVRDSGYRKAAFFARLGAQIPHGAWLESIAPDGDRLAITGRALHLATVADAMDRLERASFHHVTLNSISRIVLPGREPEVAFAIDVDGALR